MATCPICRKPLKDGEDIIPVWHGPLKLKTYDAVNDTHYVEKMDNMHNACFGRLDWSTYYMMEKSYKRKW